jgi:acyl-CoA synthetase (AMP-forming)/AMP-acid ligase II
MRHIFDRVATPQQKAAKRLRMPGIIQNSAPAGILVHSMMALQRGMQVFLVTKYNFDELVHMIREYELSALFLVPAVFLRITQTFQAEDLRNVRWALSGASPLSPDLQSKVNAMLPTGVNLNVNWGMTETTCGATQLEPNEKESEGSVGRLLPGMKLAILGADGRHQGPGQLGEVCLKGMCRRAPVCQRSFDYTGPNIMRSYFENPQATKAAYGKTGWFLTGDIGMMSELGKLFIKGRAKVRATSPRSRRDVIWAHELTRCRS